MHFQEKKEEELGVGGSSTASLLYWLGQSWVARLYISGLGACCEQVDLEEISNPSHNLLQFFIC